MEEPSRCVSTSCHSPVASLKRIIWLSNLYGCPIYDSLVQTSPPKKRIGNSLCSRVAVSITLTKEE